MENWTHWKLGMIDEADRVKTGLLYLWCVRSILTNCNLAPSILLHEEGEKLGD